MNVKQQILRFIYPSMMTISKLFVSKNGQIRNEKNIVPKESIYNLSFISNKGENIQFERFKGKIIVVANTASGCGFTAQYEELEKLQQLYASRLVVIGFPTDEFGNQEPLNDKEIATFCSTNFGTSFLMAKKSKVLKTNEQQPVYKWLTNPTKNGWNEKQPNWNFCKYIINEEGRLTHFFPSIISPISQIFLEAVDIHTKSI